MLYAAALLAVGFTAGFAASYYVSHRKKNPFQLPEPAEEPLILYNAAKVNAKTRSDSIRIESLLQDLYTCLISKKQSPELEELLRLSSKTFLERYQKTAQTFHDGISKSLVESLDIYGQQQLVSAYSLFETVQDDLEKMSKHMLPLILHAEESSYLFQNTVEGMTKLMNEGLRRLDKVDETIDSALYGGNRQKELVVEKQDLLLRLQILQTHIDNDPALQLRLAELETRLRQAMDGSDMGNSPLLAYYTPTVLSVMEYYQSYGSDNSDLYKLILRSLDSLNVMLKGHEKAKLEQQDAKAAVELTAMERYAQMKGDLPGQVQEEA